MHLSPLRCMFVFGTRPEAIKLAPVIRQMQEDPRFAARIVVTGQHREMLQQALDEFGIKPDIDLEIMEHGQSLSDIAVRTLARLAPVLRAERPEILIVHGDTLAMAMASLSAFFEQIPVAHVEAGLRTYRRYDPFPEEMNRRLAVPLASFHFAPSRIAKWNLLREGVPLEDVFIVGNTVIDALISAFDPDHTFKDPVLARIDFGKSRVLLVTAHRRENWGRPMERIFRALTHLARSFSDVQIVLPLHKNPAIRGMARNILEGMERILLVEPPGYRDFVNLMARATLILTDSGGIQEEGPALGKTVLVLRETTERPEAVATGYCVPVGTTTEAIVEQTACLLEKAGKESKPSPGLKNTPYGDGKAAWRICEILWSRLRRTPMPEGVEWSFKPD